MSALLDRPSAVTPAPAPALFTRTCSVELRKVLAHWRTRVALLLCAVAPAAFAALVPSLGSLPTDTLFGRWLQDSGLAVPLVVLGFAGGWALPVLTVLVAGDIFAMEDRLGTWRSLLVAARSGPRVFAAKALVAFSYTLSLVVLLAASSLVGGLVLVGRHPLPALDGRLLTTAQAVPLVVGSWASVIAPALAFAALGLLCSVAFGRSPLGLGLPVLFALGGQVVNLVPMPAALRQALPGSAFLAWRGLLTGPAQVRSVWVSVAVSLTWAALATALAYRLFRGRDFASPAFDGVGGRPLAGALAGLAALLLATTGVLSAAPGPDGITRRGVESSLSTVFANLYVLQQRELANPPVTPAGIGATASCDKGGQDVADQGPGNDWRCVVTWHVSGATAPARALYQLDVAADGRYVADGDGPKEVNGWFTVATPSGPRDNPLWQLDGLVNQP